MADNPTESTGIASNGQPDDGAAVAVAPSDQPSSADNNSDANSRRKPGHDRRINLKLVECMLVTRPKADPKLRGK